MANEAKITLTAGETIHTCPICHSTENRIIQQGRIALVRCGSCDAVFSSTSSGSEYYQHTYHLTRELSPFEAERRRIEREVEFWKYLGLAKKHFLDAKKWLDVGADRGFFCDAARRAGFAVAGVEPSEAGRRYAESIGIYLEKSIDDLPENSFDVVSMWHVLEHIAQPTEILDTIASRLLRRQGLLMVRVPDYGSLTARIAGKKWVWLQPEQHILHFTQKTLAHCLEKSGFEIITLKSQYANTCATALGHSYSQAVERAYSGTSLFASSSLLSQLRYIWHHITGVEIFALARKK